MNNCINKTSSSFLITKTKIIPISPENSNHNPKVKMKDEHAKGTTDPFLIKQKTAYLLYIPTLHIIQNHKSNPPQNTILILLFSKISLFPLHFSCLRFGVVGK